MTDTTPMTYFQQRMAEIDADESLRRPNAYIHRNVTKETNRHGRVKYYYRVGKGKRTRLPDPDIVGKLAFQRACEAAANDLPVDLGRTPARVSLNYLSGATGRTGFVYFIKMGNTVKIGFSHSAGQRLKTIQTSCPEPAELLKVVPGTMATELFFHDHFAKYRLSGEWFSLEGSLVAFLY